MSPLIRRKSARRRGIHPLLISAIVIFATVFVTYYAFNQGLPFIHKFTLYALTNNSVNVRTDSPVRIAGIDVGTVSGVSPGPGNTSKITFSLDSNGQPVHTDATIVIRDRLFLEGGYYLALDPGTPAAPIVHDGFTFASSQVSSPVQFFNILSTFDLAARASLANTLNTLNQGFSAQPGQPESDSGAGGLKAAVPELTPVFKDTALITRALRGTQPGDIERLLTSASQVTTTLSNSSAQLADLVTGLDRTSTALAAADGSLARSVSGLDHLLRVAPASLAAVDRSLPPVAALGQALDPSLKIAPPILDGVTNAVRQLAVIVAPVERGHLLASLKATFQQFPSVLTELGHAFPITRALTQCLSTHVTPILTSEVPDGSLSTGMPVWKDFVHFLPNVAGASASFDGNGPYTKTLLGAGTNTLELLNNLPLIGNLVGTQLPGGGNLQGASPSWVGDLTPADFRPDVPCNTQPVPSLAAPTASPDTRAVRSPAATPLTSAALHTEMARAAKVGSGK
jgi:phospholipid/cholesterol/gamma-HCH transport system substrate-binding protein